ncbi:hypothetical protein [Kitasatospora sp. NPDC093679]|uniref:hypothetical protein n=1 Tax=Kitasatospora sp. NPDC093679 TaxID=3154983 RepID=UPI003436554D
MAVLMIETVPDWIGVRTRNEVLTAAEEAAHAHGDRTEARGEAAVLRWVLAPYERAPLTGARTSRSEPTDLDLAVEERAALQAARDRELPPSQRAFARGAARALGWVLGFEPLDP